MTNVLTQLSFKLASQSQSAVSLQGPEIKSTGVECDGSIARMLGMLQDTFGREFTIEQAKDVCQIWRKKF